MTREKFTFEYLFYTTPQSLYRFVSTPVGLSQWFADKVIQKNSSDDFFTVWWGKAESNIKILYLRDNVSAKYCWEEDFGSEYFFEFEIQQHEMTKEVSLKITDFAEHDELDDIESIWNENIKRLKRKLGSK